MSLPELEKLLYAYQQTWPKGLVSYQGIDRQAEAETVQRITRFITEHKADGLLRTCLPGHLTASALVVSPRLDKVLLMLHAKLGKWLQLGGHVDGDPDPQASAVREAREESGREEVQPIAWDHFTLGPLFTARLPFDCDVHAIPARKDEGEHFHFDLRYLCVLDDALPLCRNEESHDLRWLDLTEARRLTNEPSMLRQFAKLEALRPFYHP